MPGLVMETTAQFRGAPAAAAAAAAAASGSGIWSRRRDEITFDRLQKFWNDLPHEARQELLRIDKQTLIEQARKNLYCSRCNGLLLESFTQIVMYGKSLQHEGSGMALPIAIGESRNSDGELDEVQDPSLHPWGGLATTKEGILTLLDCFVNAKSLKALQNVFDNARAREREREMLYPDACGGGGRGWISQGIANFGRGHGTRETCALHTARLSCDTLVDFWSALGEETRTSLLRMKEEDFIERLMYRFDSKRFCRDCRRNVIREFKELKELKRMRREPRCTSWFCVADTAFLCEVSEDAVLVDWHQSFSETDGSYHHFEWAIGTDEGKADILDFEDVGMNGQVLRDGLNLDQFDDCFITLRAWRLDGRCTEFCVKAHALKGQSCVHRRMVVGDGFVTITKGESIRKFFEHAEEAEEEDEDDAMDRDGNDLDGDGSHPQKHAKSPELAREFLLDAATVIFKEQVEKAFREGTARQNAHSVFVSLALKLLEERVHVACKEIITLEKQTKLLEEEEREKREEEERRERRRTKEREKKHRRKERLKEKERDKEKKLVEPKSSDDNLPSSLINLSTCTNDESPNSPDSRDSASEEEDNSGLMEPCSPVNSVSQSSSGGISGPNGEDQCDTMTEFASTDCADSFISEQSKSSRRKMRSRKDFAQDASCCWYDNCRDESGSMGDLHGQSRDWSTRNTTRCSNASFATNNRPRDRYDYNSCSCGHQEDYRTKDSYFPLTARSGRELKIARKSLAVLEKPRSQYRRCYPLDTFVVSKGSRIGSALNKNAILKQVWEPMDARKKTTLDNVGPSKQIECPKVDGASESLAEAHSERLEEDYKSDTDQICEKDKNNQAACQSGPVLVTQPDCYLGKDAVLEQDAGLTTNFASSDNSSSCLSEGDRDSSVSSTTSSSAQNLESSSTSDSEESSERNNNIAADSSARTASRSLLETCTGNGFREFQPKAVHLSSNGRFGTSLAPLQERTLHHQSRHVPPYSSATLGLQNHSWGAPTTGYLPYAQPAQFSYPSPLGYGVPGNQCADFQMQYNNVHPYPAPALGVVPQQPLHKTAANFSVMPPPQPYVHGAEQVRSRHSLGHLSLERHCHLPSKSKLISQKELPENAAKSQDKSAPFSLFQFNLPIAPPAPQSSKDEKSKAAGPKAPVAQPQRCSREESNVKEYNLFSARSGGMFSFL